MSTNNLSRRLRHNPDFIKHNRTSDGIKEKDRAIWRPDLAHSHLQIDTSETRFHREEIRFSLEISIPSHIIRRCFLNSSPSPRLLGFNPMGFIWTNTNTSVRNTDILEMRAESQWYQSRERSDGSDLNITTGWHFYKKHFLTSPLRSFLNDYIMYRSRPFIWKQMDHDVLKAFNITFLKGIGLNTLFREQI